MAVGAPSTGSSTSDICARIPSSALILALDLAGIDRGQLLSARPRARAAACIRPAASRPSSRSRAISCCCLQTAPRVSQIISLRTARRLNIVQSVDQPVEMDAQVRCGRVGQARVGLFNSQSIAVHR